MGNTCDYCGNSLNRKVFCKRSHQVMFNRQGKLQKQLKEVIEKREIALCKHGMAKGLCKYGDWLISFLKGKFKDGKEEIMFDPVDEPKEEGSEDSGDSEEKPAE